MPSEFLRFEEVTKLLLFQVNWLTYIGISLDSVGHGHGHGNLITLRNVSFKKGTFPRAE